MRTVPAKALLGACLSLVGTGLPGVAAWAGEPTSVTLPVPVVAPQPAPPDNCGGGYWPPEVSGRPSGFAAGNRGAYLWYDPDGAWALRVTHYGPRDRAVFSGILQTGGKFVDVHSFGQGNDIVAVARNQHAIVFRFVNYGWVDGLDFATTCSAGFTVSIDVNGQRASPGAIHLGSGGVSPASNPFRVQRGRGRAPQTTTTTTSTQPGGEPPTTSANPDHHHDRAPRWPGGPGT